MAARVTKEEIPGPQQLPSGEIRAGTVEGFSYWMIRRIQHRLRKSEAGTLTWIVDRLFDLDAEYLKQEFGVSLDKFEDDMGAEILNHPRR